MNTFVKAVVFDLDGTLLDTLADLTDSVNFALTTLGLPIRTQDEVRQMIGNGVSVLMQRALGPNLHLHSQALKLQRQYYAANACTNTKPYPNVENMLAQFKQLGIAVVVHTNKDKTVAMQLCQQMFGNLVDEVCGTEADGITKPNATKLMKLLRQMNVNAACYCGDSDVDIQTAANANLPCISVTWGFRSKKYLTGHGAMRLADDPQQVVELCTQIFGQGQ